MRKLLTCSVLAVAVVAAPAEAKKKPENPYCIPKAVGFNARGTLVESQLTQGADHRWSGTITVDVRKANHGAPRGQQTYTVQGVKLRAKPKGDTTFEAGDRVKFQGKITKSTKKCTATATTVTVKRIEIRAPRS